MIRCERVGTKIVTYITLDEGLEDPFSFGMLLVDVARHANDAYGGDVLDRIMDGFDAERDNYTTELEPLRVQ